MELGALIVFLAVFAGCGAVVFVISFFGTQTETFEEALEKQRNQQNKDKEKKKEKKPVAEKKKKLKKGKDAKNNNVAEYEDDGVLVDPAGQVVEPVYIEPVKEVAAATVQQTTPPPAQEEPKPAEKPKKEEKKEKKKEEKVTAKVPVPVKEAVVEESVPVKTAAKSAAQETVPAKSAAKTAAQDNVAAKSAAKTAVEEAAPAPAAVKAAQEPAAKETKVEKKKMEIQEVATMVQDDADEKKKKKGGKEKAKKKSHYEDVLETVRKVTLSDTEVQGIVDVLLMKQTGKEDTSGAGEWVEPGKETEAKKMTRQLAEMTEQLEEEKNKASGLEKKMVNIRKEMNESKRQVETLKREMEDVNNKKTQEISRFNTTIQQLRGDLNTSQTYHIQMEGKYQTEIRTMKEQLDRAAQMAAPSDAQLVAEIEQLKSANAELNTTQSALHHKFTQKCSEVETATAALQQQLEAANNEKNKLSSELVQAMEAQKKLSSQLEAEKKLSEAAQSRLTEEEKLRSQAREEAEGNSQQVSQQLESVSSAKQQLESQLSAVSSAKQQLQSELNALKDKLSEKEVENSRLLEENERLSEQVASSVERPAAEGEEAVNGHVEIQEQKKVVESAPVDWEDRYNKLNMQLQQRSSQCEATETELTSTKSELDKLRAKNDEVSTEYSKYRRKCEDMLAVLFPSTCAQSKDLETIQTQAKQFIQDLEKDASQASKVSVLTEELQKLESQSVSYKTVLAQTENMLNSLQASVETAEIDWKKKVDASESECSQLKNQVKDLESKNTELENKLKSHKNLEDELVEERSSKEILAKKCAELQELIVIGDKQISISNSQDEALTNGDESMA